MCDLPHIITHYQQFVDVTSAASDKFKYCVHCCCSNNTNHFRSFHFKCVIGQNISRFTAQINDFKESGVTKALRHLDLKK